MEERKMRARRVRHDGTMAPALMSRIIRRLSGLGNLGRMRSSGREDNETTTGCNSEQQRKGVAVLGDFCSGHCSLPEHIERID